MNDGTEIRSYLHSAAPALDVPQTGTRYTHSILPPTFLLLYFDAIIVIVYHDFFLNSGYTGVQRDFEVQLLFSDGYL